MRFLPSRAAPELRAAIPPWLDQWEFTHFFTLTFNNSYAGDLPAPGSKLKHGRLRSDLKRWNLHVDRELLGKRGILDVANRPFMFLTLEKPNVHPHWHGLIRFMTNDPAERLRQEAEFAAIARRRWHRIVPSGSVDVQPITAQEGVAKYIAKTLGYELCWEHFIVPDELWNG